MDTMHLLPEFSGAIFDVDGTILDSMFMWRGLTADYLLGKGVSFPDNLLDIIRPMTVWEMCVFFNELGVKVPPEQINAELDHTIRHFYAETAKPKSGVREYIQKLHQSGTRMVIATATPRREVEAALDRLDLLKYFIGLFTCPEVGKGKDFPDVFLAAAEQLQLPPEKTMVFEDSYFAIRTAKSAGFLTCGLFDKTSEGDTGKIRPLCDCYLGTFLNA